jgi:hypothetical protein
METIEKQGFPSSPHQDDGTGLSDYDDSAHNLDTIDNDEDDDLREIAEVLKRTMSAKRTTRKQADIEATIDTKLEQFGHTIDTKLDTKLEQFESRIHQTIVDVIRQTLLDRRPATNSLPMQPLAGQQAPERFNRPPSPTERYIGRASDLRPSEHYERPPSPTCSIVSTVSAPLSEDDKEMRKEMLKAIPIYDGKGGINKLLEYTDAIEKYWNYSNHSSWNQVMFA